MSTRLYYHSVFLEHLTPPGHPERPDRLRVIERVLEDERFAWLDRREAPEADPATILYAHVTDADLVETIRDGAREAEIPLDVTVRARLRTGA